MAPTDAEGFRKQAEDCRQEAAKAVNPVDKASWLKLAEDWLRLAQSSEGRNKRP